MFISVIRATNDFEIPNTEYSSEERENYHLNDDLMRPHLEDYFSKEQLGLIEMAFEVDDNLKSCLSKEKKDSAIRFGNLFYEHERLIAIMENIIENKGTFEPNK